MSETRHDPDFDQQCMRRALELAKGGEGLVEPNPMVGCVIAAGGRVLGEGFHQKYGEAHAEVEAIRIVQQQGDDARNATVYVTLEPCCHQGKTPPCSEALIAAGVQRVVIAMRDPFPQVDGGGVEALSEAGMQVETGLLEEEAQDLNAPYLRRVRDGRPWVIAKWAMSLDGKIATAGGDSQWISNEASRREVHRLRGRMDAILVGSGTALADDPLLTARPPGPRVAMRIICDSSASLPTDSKLCQTAQEAPVLLACAPDADPDRVAALAKAGCRIWQGVGTADERLARLLKHLGRGGVTNVLVEGGGRMMSAFWRLQLIDEVHAYVAPKLIAGGEAPTPIGGVGAAVLSDAANLRVIETTQLDGDVRIVARTLR